ncbi:MAG: hypothetical protein RLZZ244_2959 [Verrucomicrobiota bacterium]
MKYRMRWMSVMGAVVLAGGPLGAGAEPGPGSASDLFESILDGKPPQILKELLPAPEGVRVRRVLFRTRGKNMVYAVIASPKAPGPHPGMLLLHGSGGSAEEHKALAWAQRGYVALAPDIPGLYSPLTSGNLPMSKNYAEGRYALEPDSTHSVIYDGVLAAVKALDLLRAQPEVDPQRVGVCGVSWGGTMTTMVCALAGEKVRAAFAIYGCGFFELGNWRTNKPFPGARAGSWAGNLRPEEAEKWLRDFDPGRRAKGIKAAFFHASAANDFFGWPEAVQATLDAIPGEKNHVYAPNSNHRILVPGGSVFAEDEARGAGGRLAGSRANWVAMEVPYFEYHLKGVGEAMPRVSLKESESPHTARFEVRSTRPLAKVEVYWARAFTAEECADSERLRQAQSKREWISVEARGSLEEGYRAELPREAGVWFALVTDDRPVSVSSPLVSLPGAGR